MLAKFAKDIFPGGVFNVLTDVNDLGPLLTAHPDIAKISFTGSTATGKKVLESAAGTLKRVTLELGRNDASIVLEDVDVAKLARKISASEFNNAGRVGIAANRVSAHHAASNALCADLAKIAESALVGVALEQRAEERREGKNGV